MITRPLVYPYSPRAANSPVAANNSRLSDRRLLLIAALRASMAERA